MKNYAIFIDKKGDDIMGSDSLFPLDGRWNYYTACEKAEIQAWRLKHVRKEIAGFQIYRGRFPNGTSVNQPTFFKAEGPRGNL